MKTLNPLLAGAATPDATAQYALAQGGEFGPPAYRRLGRTGLTVFALGFGGYRIDDNIPEHGASLERAIRHGCNLIDTSTNYTDGSSELLVGKTLRRLVEEKIVTREQVVVVSKVGYVQGSNLALAREREESGKPFPDMVKYADGCWHCLHPEFIADQLTRSLARLGLAKLDVLLLHNPEYFLSDLKQRNSRLSLPERRERFYDRVRSAFAYLEEEVTRGRLGAYGVSSNTFGAAADGPETTSLTRMWDIAADLAKRQRGAADKHNFSVIQLPMNLFESGPALERNNGARNEKTVLELAQEKSLGVLVNRPLNAFFRGQLMRLADPQTVTVATTQKEQAHAVSLLEQEFGRTVAPNLDTGDGNVPAQDLFRWGRELGGADLSQVGYDAWMQLESDMVRPQVGYLIGQLDAHLGQSPLAAQWTAWRDRYVPALETLLAVIRSSAADSTRGTVQALVQRLDPHLPEAWRSASLSRKALGIVANTPGVTSVLNGMRRPRYVDDSMGAAKLPPFVVSQDLYTSFRFPEGNGTP